MRTHFETEDGQRQERGDREPDRAERLPCILFGECLSGLVGEWCRQGGSRQPCSLSRRTAAFMPAMVSVPPT